MVLTPDSTTQLLIPRTKTRLLRLAFLAPDIVTAILNGRQSPQLTANRLMDDTRLPLDWTAQRELLRP